jgi:hypothetical protein
MLSCCLQDIIPEDKQPELLGTISKGNITMRVLRDIFESFINMGPLSQVGCGGQGGACEQCVSAWFQGSLLARTHGRDGWGG